MRPGSPREERYSTVEPDHDRAAPATEAAPLDTAPRLDPLLHAGHSPPAPPAFPFSFGRILVWPGRTLAPWRRFSALRGSPTPAPVAAGRPPWTTPTRPMNRHGPWGRRTRRSRARQFGPDPGRNRCRARQSRARRRRPDHRGAVPADQRQTRRERALSAAAGRPLGWIGAGARVEHAHARYCRHTGWTDRPRGPASRPMGTPQQLGGREHS